MEILLMVFVNLVNLLDIVHVEIQTIRWKKSHLNICLEKIAQFE